MRPDRADRFAGSLLAQALGDALGFVVEGEHAEVCAPYAARLRAGDLVPRAARPGHAVGQYSDDTQLARALAESLLARRGFEPADYAARIAALFAVGRVVGHGPSTEAAARRLAAGVPWHEAGTPGPVAGNGGAMRVGPLALWFAHDPAALGAAAHAQARITHADPRCGAGAVVIAVAVARAGDAADALCSAAARAAEPLDPVLAAAVAALPRWLPEAEDAAASVLASVGLPPGEDSGRHGIAPHVTPSVLWSLYAALRHHDDLGAALATAIAVGGDVDTTAAMTGAIVGARLGAAALPAAALAPLHDRGEHGADALRALAHALAALSG